MRETVKGKEGGETGDGETEGEGHWWSRREGRGS